MSPFLSKKFFFPSKTSSLTKNSNSGEPVNFDRKILPKTGLKSHPAMKCAMENNILTDIAALR